MEDSKRNFHYFGYSLDNVDKRSVYEFHNILEQSDFSKYHSFQYILSEKSLSNNISTSIIPQHLPNEFEIITHLKLIKALSLLKTNVLAGTASYTSISIWRQFVTNAVRRFMVFLTSLKIFIDTDLGYSFGSPDSQNYQKSHFQFTSMMTQLMPPLDVIMVWHSFLLHPKSYYTVLTSCKMKEFANIPLPLHLISQFIDNCTFEFNVPHEYKYNYFQIIKCTTTDMFDLQYKVDRVGFDRKYVTVTCPHCKHVISEPIKLLNEMGTGFFDTNFATENIFFGEQSPCYCSKIENLTHVELRKLQFFTDASKGKSPITFFHKKAPIQTDDLKRTSQSYQELFRQSWETIQAKDLNDIILILEEKCNKESLPQAFLLSSYRKLDLISMTVPGDIQIGENLVEFVLRQESFNNNMNNLNWLHSKTISSIISEATTRYSNFYPIITHPKLSQELKSTLDIDLVWYTHQLCAYGYFQDCLMSPNGCIVDQRDTISNLLIDNSETFTANLYKTLYGQDYFICYCNSCTSMRYGISHPVIDPTTNANSCLLLDNKLLSIDLNMAYPSSESNSIMECTPGLQQYSWVGDNPNDFLTYVVTKDNLDKELIEKDQRIMNNDDFSRENVDCSFDFNIPEVDNAFRDGQHECPNNEFLRLWCMI